MSTAPSDRADPADLADPVDRADLADLADFVGGGDVVVLSGAGLSTDSGIPDYRGPSGVRRRHAPMTFQAFTKDAVARHRYWARSYVGWHQIGSARPNAGHTALADLEHAGFVAGTVTQNVDGLHQAAGARTLIELHGGLDRVVCSGCGAREDRRGLDARLRLANPRFRVEATGVNPDGDVDLPDGALDAFVMVDCLACGGGPLKPDVVFFGETVPKDRVAASFAMVDAARALLVVGSSLTVMSGYRFVRHARTLGTPVALVNQGVTRADPHVDLRLDAPLGAVLPALANRLLRPLG